MTRPTALVAVQTWSPPTATTTTPAVFPDTFAVTVLDQLQGARVVAVVELVSPGNKDRTESRAAFVAKCGGYLQAGIGLIVADVVTSRRANLHNELIEAMRQPAGFAMTDVESPYTTAYRPVSRRKRNEIDLWLVPLAVGVVLPVLPLALLGGIVVPVDLEAAYVDARQRARL